MNGIVSATPPILVLGTARSGTTLITRMLTAHPRIFIKNELPSVTNVFRNDTSEADILEAISGEIQRIYKTDFDAFLRAHGKVRWGLKDPNFTYCLSALDKYFPDVKILIIVRDGRAVANSSIRNKWGLCTNTYTGALRWREEMEIQEAFIERNRGRCYIFHYETLVAEPESELKGICNFIQEPYDPVMLDYAKQPISIRRTRESENTFKDLDSKLTTRWQQELSPRQIDIFESVAGGMLTRYGYPLMGAPTKVSRALAAYYHLHQRIIGEIQTQYQWRIGPLIRTWAAGK